ncbi:hypothetical protein V6Z77_010186 [Aspergillus fumigatus]
MGPPASQIRTRERLHARSWPGRGRWFYVEGESRVTSGGVRALRRPLLPCQAGRLSVTGGAQVPSVGPRFRNGGSRPSQPWFLLSSGRRAASWSGRPGCRRGSERPAMGAPVTPRHATGARPGAALCCA